MKLGAAAYAFCAAGLLTSAVATLRHVGPYDDVSGWTLIVTTAVIAGTGLLFAYGAVTRRGLAAHEGRWLDRNGWIPIAALTVIGVAVSMVIGGDVTPVPTGPAVFVPRWIRKMQESYHAGRAEAVSEEAPDVVRLPTS